MKFKISPAFLQALGIGVLAGMRSTAAPIIASHILSHHHSRLLEESPLNFMQSKKVDIGFKLMALTEIIGDKLPSTPNRIKAPVIAARCLSGALAGASIFKGTGGNAILGGLLGGAAAFGSTFGSFYLRKSIVAETKFFDPIIGGIEDVLVIGAGVGLIRLS